MRVDNTFPAPISDGPREQTAVERGLKTTLLPEIEQLPNVIICNPIPNRSIVRLINRSSIIVTDSGCLEQEGPTLGKPVLVTRDTTDRPEAFLAGGVRLVGTDTESVADSVTQLLHDPTSYASMAVPRNVDGHAGQRAVAAIAHMLGLGPRPERFFRTSTLKAVAV
jgi:UDP-N-acetylglucosamine 2-epimerase (non-hydrolysing)